MSRRIATARDPEATRRALLDAATEAFAEAGFDGARVEDIAQRAGVNKAMINYHFKNKLGLHQSILLATFSELISRLHRLRDENLPAAELLPRYLAAYAEVHGQHPDLSVMIAREALEGGRHMTPEILGCFLEFTSFTREMVMRGMREGSFRELDPFLTHLTLVGSLLFFHATRRLRERLVSERHVATAAPRPNEFLAHVQELMRRGLAADAREA